MQCPDCQQLRHEGSCRELPRAEDYDVLIACECEWWAMIDAALEEK